MGALLCVTGAGGFIAGHLIEQLLDKGYSVRGTVRNLDDAADGFLPQLPGARERLELVWADLLKEGSFDLPVEGCETVFHVASPFVLHADDPQRDLVEPAIQGTLNVLRACARSSSVSRVVLTSSIAAIAGKGRDRVFTEADWNVHSRVDNNPYYFAKTAAERAAWSFMEHEAPTFDLVVLNPGNVMGPSHRQSVNTSVGVMQNLLTGDTPAIVDLDMWMVDVRDVAAAHVLAMETPDAAGRYICTSATVTTRELVETLKRSGYRHKLPRLALDSTVGTQVARVVAAFQPRGVRQYLRAFLGRRSHGDNSKIRRDLGIEFRPVEETILDTAADLVAKGHIPPA